MNLCKRLFLIVFLFNFNFIFSKTHTNKTFLSLKSQLDDFVLEKSIWKRRSFKKISNKKDIGIEFENIRKKHSIKNKICTFENSLGFVQFSTFYKESLNKSALGKYFGYYATNENIIRDYISIADQTLLVDSDAINSNYILHSGVPPQFGGKISFRPNQKNYGIRFDYYQSISNVFFKISSEYIRVINNISPNIMGTLLYDDVDNIPKNILDYLKGDLEETIDTRELQKKLTNLKIDRVAKSGFADINFTLGFNLLNNKNKIAFFINTLIPTGNKAKGEYLWEPICGNGKYYLFGIGIDSSLELWNQDSDRIELFIYSNLKYLFKNTQKRTISLKDDSGNKINFGHYYLGGKKDELEVFPLANVLTQEVKVEPFLHFDAVIGLSFKSGSLIFDLGYELFAKNGERVKLKNPWPATLYSIANPDYETTEDPSIAGYGGPFDPTNANHYESSLISGPITKQHLDFESITTPSSILQKIFTEIGYCFNNFKYPLNISIGSSYSFLGGNASTENFTIYSKLGLFF